MITEKMLKRGYIDLNYAQECANTFKEESRQRMVNQELVFRTQVYELHRLYGIQRTLMEEFKQKEFESCNLMESHPQLTSAPLKTSGYDIRVTEGPFPAATGGNSTWPRKQKFWEEQKPNLHYKQWNGCHDVTQRPLDLHLSADEFINNVDQGLPERGTFRNSFEAPTGFQSPLQVDKVSDLKDVKLSLSIRDNIIRRSGDGKKNYWITHDVIDLEDPSLSFSNNNAYSVAPAGCAASSSSRIAKGDLVHWVSNSIDIGANCPRRSAYGSGFNGQHSETPSTDFFKKSQLSTSCRALDLDLNRVQLDTSSYFSNKSIVLNSVCGSSGASQQVDCWRSGDPSLVSTSSVKINTNYLVENPIICQEDDAVMNFSLIDGEDRGRETLTKEGAEYKGANGGEVEIIDLESVSGLSYAVEKPIIHGSEPRNESIGSQPKTSGEHSCDEHQMNAVGEQVKLEEDMENIVFSHPCQVQMTAEDHNLSGSCKCDNNVDNQSSSIRTMQSGIECGDSHLSTSDETQKASLQSQVEESPLGESDQRSSDSTESNHQYIDKKRQAEVDELVQAAAELLICISLESPVNQRDGSIKVASEELQIEDHDVPQYSCDSYEAIVLTLKESSLEECSVTSKAFEVSESDKRDFGYRLKRGTRMRDFQKDILPGLSTLSRHEICEDINIMESVIRSREYRKMRSQMDDGGAWSKTRRNRRTRTNYCRRYYA
ncbi:hypothetical protein Ancab_014962 [Ancistrocladus abbreviatus]